MTVKVKHLSLDGYRGWKTVALRDITLPSFNVDEVIKYLIKLHDLDEEDRPSKGEFHFSCNKKVINWMGEENGEQFILIG